MIPVWLAPILAKHGVKIVAVVLVAGFLFSCGWWASGRYWKPRYSRLERLLDASEANLDTCLKNFDVVKEGLERQNAELDKLHEETVRRIDNIEAAHEEATNRLRRHYGDIISSQDREAAALRERLALLPEKEACREAWKELVK